ncbi:hypothetical protein LTR56_005550 [Elasticomyces elasticus]|nr:hypothetical protein LTR22_017137 [Elasticomyces elasticus]KAK3651742.1 hypothetical protein LTR56_005550 [Elasticomyces elasticus]KAK4913353.1 hypothetical protein LTR49_018334 [Elasticomyces elasticus]KAK5769159.1 hypothetical protein LTS12_000510 [Elasticomyces elasticus]
MAASNQHADDTRPWANRAPLDHEKPVAFVDQKNEAIVASESLSTSPTDSIASSWSAKGTAAPATSANVLQRLRAAITQRRQQRSEPVWHSSSLEVRPLLGLTALAFAIGCMLVSLAVLLASNNQAIKTWAVQPTVYLAIAAALANAALGIARYNAVPICWWHTVTRGSTIADLERQWEVGHSLVLALRHHRRMGFTGFATVLVAIMIIDGPLLQRSVTVRLTTTTDQVTLALNLAQEVPTGFSGSWYGLGLTTSDISAKLSTEWRDGAPILLDVKPCNGICAATVRAPGVMMDKCDSQTWHISNEMYHDANATWGIFGHTYDASFDAFTNPMFSVQVSNFPLLDIYDSEVVALELGSLSFNAPEHGDITGEYVYSTCYYVPAILEYDILIAGKQATLLDHAGQGKLVSRANNTRSNWTMKPDVAKPSTIDQLTLWLNLFVGVNASVTFANSDDPSNAWHIDPRTVTNGAALGRYIDPEATGDALTIKDPAHDIITQMNNMMFRAGVMSATSWSNLSSLIDAGLPVQQSIVANRTITQDVYHSDLRWFAGAAAIELLAILMVLPLFWGWWRLGRTTLLSPVELALAFDAPLFRDVNSAQRASQAVGKFGTTEVKYGAVGNTPYRLGIAERQNVLTPHQGMRFER